MAQKLDSEIGEGNSSSLKEIAAAFGDVTAGETARDPTAVWEEKAPLDESWTADFSQMTVVECNALATCKNIPVQHELKPAGPTKERNNSLQSANVSSLNTNGSSFFPLLPSPDLKSPSFQLQDPHYINHLERKLEKLYEKNGRLDKKSMLKQLKHRSDNLLNTAVSSDVTGSSYTTEGTGNSNLVTRRLFPEQALTAEEKLKLVRHDQLELHQDENSESCAANTRRERTSEPISHNDTDDVSLTQQSVTSNAVDGVAAVNGEKGPEKREEKGPDT